MTLRDSVTRHPVAVPVAVCLIDALVVLVWGQDTASSPSEGLAPRLVLIAALGSLLAWLRRGRRAGLRRAGFWRAVLLGTPLIALGVLLLATTLPHAGGYRGWLALTVFTLNMGLVGLHEELLVRGLVLPLMLESWGHGRAGVWRAVMVSSAVFSVMHLVNLGTQGTAVTLAQVLFAACVGVFFAAIFVRTSNLWGLVAIHALFDWCAYLAITCFPLQGSGLSPASGQAGALVLVSLPFAVIAGVYLRPGKLAATTPLTGDLVAT